MYLMENLDDEDVPRRIFLEWVFKQEEPFYYGASYYSTKMSIRTFAGLHPKANFRFGGESDRFRTIAFSIKFRGSLHHICARKSPRQLTVSVLSPDQESWTRYMLWLDKKIPIWKPTPKPVDLNCVDVNFLYRNSMGMAQTRERRISAPSWKLIKDNYPVAARDSLESLLDIKLEDLSGHFGVLHGPPGTGKTHYLRALMQAWRNQANFLYVMDPEDLFNDASYLDQALFDNARAGTWNVILCEDAEEFIAPDAKKDVGQALSRLLNLGDGMLGQGLQTLFIFTTNAKLDSLHPAMIRPGRCFKNIDVPLFTPKEATTWLGAPVEKEVSLAELYWMKREDES